MREIFVSSLNKIGIQALTANSLKNALEIIQKSPVDGIISDARLKDGSGLELLATARGGKDSHRPFFVLVSAFSDIRETEAEKLGVDLVLSKPLDLKSFVEAIKQLL